MMRSRAFEVPLGRQQAGQRNENSCVHGHSLRMNSQEEGQSLGAAPIASLAAPSAQLLPSPNRWPLICGLNVLPKSIASLNFIYASSQYQYTVGKTSQLCPFKTFKISTMVFQFRVVAGTP